ncbi:hypothetical protein [Devosia aquimaris]|uniref:hypothetical protein n=1 Tax=Devosia aquimaris TaxID=2866214 RepID=UPI001CD1121C|nr:hypothetical protein [Devosia sp. CJK-A8-3]
MTGRFIALILLAIAAPSAALAQPASVSVTLPDTSGAFEGSWTYRSFINDPNASVEPNNLLFGIAQVVIDEDDTGRITGTLGGSGWSLTISGQAEYGQDAVTAKFQGTGMIGGEMWAYDYFAYLSPTWDNSIDQVPALIGAVVRTAPHGGAPAGFAAQFIAVKSP